MTRVLCLALCSVFAAQSPTDTVIRLGEARFLLASDWVGVLEALGSSGIPWAFDVFSVSQQGFSWHAHAYLAATAHRGDLRRGPLAELDATYEGRGRVWRLVPGETSWAQVALAPDLLQNEFTESARGRPFLVRGTFDDDELREIVDVLHHGRPFLETAGAMIKSWGLGPVAALRRVGPNEVSSQLWPHATVQLKRTDNRWVIVSMQVSIA